MTSSDFRDLPSPVDKLLLAAEQCQKVVVFTGSGLSAASGWSFRTNLTLY